MKTEKKVAQLYFELADVFMVAIRSDETVTDINKKGCEILGYTKEEILGRNWFEDFLPIAEVENMKRVFHGMLKGAMHHVHYEHSIVTKQSGERVINWHNVLSSDEMGNVIGSLSSGSDITEQRQAEKAIKAVEDSLQKTLDSMLEGCQIVDYDYRYKFVNESAAKQGRRTKQELMGRTMTEMYPGIEGTELFGHLKKVMTNRVHDQMQNEFTFPDGSKGWFELRIEPVPEGVMVLSIDITRHKQMEAELDKYRERLEQVVAERIAQFANTNQELKKEIDEHRKTEEGLLLRAMILDNAGAAIFLVNKKGDFVYANAAASKIYGYTNKEFLNMNLRHFLNAEDKHLIESRLKEVTEKGRLELKPSMCEKTGRKCLFRFGTPS